MDSLPQGNSENYEQSGPPRKSWIDQFIDEVKINDWFTMTTIPLPYLLQVNTARNCSLAQLSSERDLSEERTQSVRLDCMHVT